MQKTAKLPKMEHVFEVNLVGRESGVNYIGRFKYKRPSLGMRSRIDVMRARLNGDLSNLDPDITEFNEVISHLRYTLTEFPDWWRDANFGLDLYDGNVVADVYNKCMEFETEWKKRVFGGDQKSVEDSNDEVGFADQGLAGTSPSLDM